MRGRLLPFVFFALAASLLAQSNPESATDGRNIRVTGTAAYGYAYLSDFNIVGPGLLLRQGSWDGPYYITRCTVGADCTWSFNVPMIAPCTQCKYNSMGSVRDVTADILKQDLIFKATGVYDGGREQTVHINFSGTVTGYKLLDTPGSTSCTDDGTMCVLGPVLFTLRISGHGTGEAAMLPISATEAWVLGISMSFSGVAHIEDTP